MLTITDATQTAPSPSENISIDSEAASVNSDSLISFSEQRHLIDSIEKLKHNISNEEIKERFTTAINMINNNHDEAEIDLYLKKSLTSLIKGNPEQALTAGTSAFFIGFAAGIASSSTISQTSLNDGFKSLLTGVGAISGGIGRLKLGIEVNKNGGSKLTSKLLLSSLCGLIITSIISESSNLKTIKELFDLRALGLLIGSLLSGFGISTFSQVSNVINWHQETGHPSAILGGIAGLAPGLVGLIRFGLLEILGNDLGQTTTSAILIATLAIGTSILTYSKNYSLIDSPCHQLMNNYQLSIHEASLLAKIYGQKFFPSENLHGDWLVLAHQLKNSKVIYLINNYIFAFGGFLGMTASLNLALASWGYNPKNAVLITSLFSFWSSLCRAMIAYPINFLEKDSLGGGVVNSVGALMVLVSALSIAIPNEVPELKRLLLALSFMAMGFGISCAATFKCVSSEVHKEQGVNTPKTPIVTAKTNALVSCLGTLGSVIYTIGGGQLAQQNKEKPELGYVQIFYAIAGLSVIGGLPVLIMSYINKDLLAASKLTYSDINNEKTQQTEHFDEEVNMAPSALSSPPPKYLGLYPGFFEKKVPATQITKKQEANDIVEISSIAPKNVNISSAL